MIVQVKRMNHGNTLKMEKCHTAACPFLGMLLAGLEFEPSE